MYRFLTIVSLMVLFLAACAKDAAEVKPELEVSVEQLTFGKDGQNKSFKLTSNVAWTITSNQTWCTVDAASGNAGTFPIKVTVAANPDFDERTAVLTVSNQGLDHTIAITQANAQSLVLKQTSFDITSDAQELTVELTRTDEITIQTSHDWIVAKALKAAIDDARTFTVDANDSYLPREGTITFTLENITETAVVRQAGIDVSIPADKTGMESSAEELAQKMIVGWNIGNTLEVPGNETGWGNPKVTKQLIDGVKAAGFNAVRIPCAWDSYIVDQSTYKIKDEWLKRVKEVVTYCVDNQMYAILNIHWDGGWLEEHPMYQYQEAVNKKQWALWTQIAVYFRDFDEHLLFAGTNEVRENYNTPSAENIEVQESYVQTFVDAVRATGGRNTWRNLVVQTYNTNIDHGISYHTMPTDNTADRMMLEAHYYDPYDFTIKTDDGFFTQWGKGYTDVSGWGQEDHLEAQFQKLKTKYIDNHIPVIIGEYSAMLRGDMPAEAQAAHEASRNYYHKTVNEVAKAKGIITFYWDNGYTHKNASGLFNRATGEVVHTAAVDAIIGVYK